LGQWLRFFVISRTLISMPDRLKIVFFIPNFLFLLLCAASNMTIGISLFIFFALFALSGPYSEHAYNDISALTCYNLRYAYYKISEINAFWIRASIRIFSIFLSLSLSLSLYFQNLSQSNIYFVLNFAKIFSNNRKVDKTTIR